MSGLASIEALEAYPPTETAEKPESSAIFAHRGSCETGNARISSAKRSSLKRVVFFTRIIPLLFFQ